ncbi:MAG: ORF6N domain-containing protein [Bacteroidales bacterium]|nr:ORF6N domain-containing protein [Bacteroidales bacterium]
MHSSAAALYGVETRYVNQAVRNNTDKFPQLYMFELNTNELRDLRSKFLTAKVLSWRNNSLWRPNRQSRLMN